MVFLRGDPPMAPAILVRLGLQGGGEGVHIQGGEGGGVMRGCLGSAWTKEPKERRHDLQRHGQ